MAPQNQANQLSDLLKTMTNIPKTSTTSPQPPAIMETRSQNQRELTIRIPSQRRTPSLTLNLPPLPQNQRFVQHLVRTAWLPRAQGTAGRGSRLLVVALVGWAGSRREILSEVEVSSPLVFIGCRHAGSKIVSRMRRRWLRMVIMSIRNRPVSIKMRIRIVQRGKGKEKIERWGKKLRNSNLLTRVLNLI